MICVLKPLFDQSLFVRASIEGVVKEALTAACLTAAMILLFLGNWRSTLIIAISIPLSILCSVITLSALGQTMNIMTLGGLALAVGILVDDATVEIENIDRNLAMGKELKQAILDGASQIAVPAFVSTICICIVFVPMFFLTGVAKFLFVPLAEAVVFAMLASYLLSRTLVPTLVMYLLKNHEHEDKFTVGTGFFAPFKRVQIAFERMFERMRDSYYRALNSAMEHRRLFISCFLAFCILSLGIVFFLGQDFFPSVDAGTFRMHVRARAGLRIEETARLCDEIENVIRGKIPQQRIGDHSRQYWPALQLHQQHLQHRRQHWNVGRGDSGVSQPGEASSYRRIRKGTARGTPGDVSQRGILLPARGYRQPDS